MREKLNPLIRVAGVLRAPAFILERAELLDDRRTRLLEAYLWFMRFVFLAGVVFVAAKLGLSVPWAAFVRLVQ